MKTKTIYILKCFLFLLILLVVLYAVNSVLEPHYSFRTAYWPPTGTFHRFYELDKNSIDVLFLGSSVAVNNFIPQVLYDEYGISSYNLGSEQQSILLSYYWLKEALRFQSPKVVVLEGLFLNDRHSDCAINTTEGLTRKTVDPMRLSSVKVQAVRDICKRDQNQDPMSYYFTNEEYHTRWKYLTDLDFRPVDSYSPKLCGWAPGREEPKPVEPIVRSDEEPSYAFRPDMVEYFEKMAALCREKQIRLVLLALPCSEMTPAIDCAYRRLAETCGVDFYDFSEEQLFRQLEAETDTDYVFDHGNLSGNQKNSALIGRILRENYGLPAHSDPQFEESRPVYRHICTGFSLKNIDDLDSYLQAIDDPRFVTFISARDEASHDLTDSAKGYLRALGLNTEWNEQTMFRRAYLAVVGEGVRYEKASSETGSEPLTYESGFNRLRNRFSLISAGYEDAGGPASSIVIDGTEYSLNKRGLNFVVYDLDRDEVVDCVTFDTNKGSIASR